MVRSYLTARILVDLALVALQLSRLEREPGRLPDTAWECPSERVS